MRKIIIHSALVTGLAVCSYWIFLLVFSNLSLGGKRLVMAAMPYLQKNGGHERMLFSEWKNTTENFDVLVLGSSHAYRGYDPRIFESYGISMFNFGTSSQHPIASEILYKNYLKGRSKVIIYDLYDVVFEIEGIECSLRLIQNLPEAELAEALVKPDIRYVNALMVRYCTLRDTDESPMKDYVKRGFCEKHGMLYRPEPLDDSIFNRNEEMFQAFERNIAEMKADGVEVILCSHPLPQNPGILNYHNGFLREIQPIIEKYNLTFLDYTFSTEGFTREEFADIAHLNQKGVERYNRALLEREEFKKLFQ